MFVCRVTGGRWTGGPWEVCQYVSSSIAVHYFLCAVVHYVRYIYRLLINNMRMLLLHHWQYSTCYYALFFLSNETKYVLPNISLLPACHPMYVVHAVITWWWLLTTTTHSPPVRDAGGSAAVLLAQPRGHVREDNEGRAQLPQLPLRGLFVCQHPVSQSVII